MGKHLIQALGNVMLCCSKKFPVFQMIATTCYRVKKTKAASPLKRNVDLSKHWGSQTHQHIGTSQQTQILSLLQLFRIFYLLISF